MIPKYRGLSIADYKYGKWIYGNPFVDGDSALILNEFIDVTDQFVTIGEWCSVDKNTLGQSTGLFDKNGKEIFEGDVVRLDSRHTMLVKYGRHYIEYKPNAYRGIGFFLITKDLPNPKYPVFPDGEYEVIGNVHQNPELLEG